MNEDIKPVEVYFELGRFQMRKYIYHPSQVEHLTPEQVSLLPLPSKLVKIHDPFYGADLTLHEKALEKAVEGLFKQGKPSLMQRIKGWLGL